MSDSPKDIPMRGEQRRSNGPQQNESVLGVSPRTSDQRIVTT